jgi:hypothetical protein
MSTYNETHNEYHLHGFEVIDGLRESLGDNDLHQLYKDRPWFTQTGRVFIRKDVDAPALVTYLLLRKR